MTPEQSPGPNKENWGCHTEDLRMVHGLFRNALQHAPGMVEGTDPRDTARIALVKGHLSEMLGVLHNHHIHEDTLYWDLITQRAPQAREDVERMKQAHMDIERDVHHVADLLTAWGRTPADKQPLLEALAALRDAVIAHLDDEERSIMPVAAQVLTQAEWDQAADMGRKETPKERLLVSIGYMMRCAPTRELANEFWTKIPPPARLMYSLFGKRKFEREWKTLYRTQT